MPKIGGFQSFKTDRRAIAGFEAMLWLRKGFGFSGNWTVNDHNDLLARLFDYKRSTKRKDVASYQIVSIYRIVCDRPGTSVKSPA